MRIRGHLLVATSLAAASLAAGCGSSEPDAAAGGGAAEPALEGPVRVAAAGDLGMKPPGVATLRAMARAEPDAYLALGDLSYAGPGSAGEYCDLVDATIGGEAPFEILSGNHEEDSGEDGAISEFAECLPDRLGASGEYARQYYFDLGGLARFILISPDLTIDGRHYYYGLADDGRDTPQLAWLKAAIAGARADGIGWVIVGMHKNCISVGEYYCDVYQELLTTLVEEKVDLVLSGHEHTYQRSKQIAAPAPGCPEVIVDRYDPDCVAASGDSYRRGDGSAFVIAGSGGAPLYEVHPDDPEAGYFAAAMGRDTPGARPGFALLSISPEALQVRFVGSQPGSFEDGFEITAR